MGRSGLLDTGQFCEQLKQALQQYSQEPIVKYYDVSGSEVVCRFYGEALLALSLPLAHLAQPKRSGSMPFTIHVWESEQSGIAMPPPPWDASAYQQSGLVKGFNTDTIQTFFCMGTSTLTIINHETQEAFYWIRSWSQVPDYEKAAPFKLIFHNWLRHHNKHLVHAGCIGWGDQAALLIGPGGTGKSTLSLLGLMSGAIYLSDDYCIVSQDDEGVVAHTLYCTGKIGQDTLTLFPLLQTSFAPYHYLSTYKEIYNFLPLMAPTPKSLRLRTIILPSHSNPQIQLKALSKKVAVQSLIPNTLFQLIPCESQDYQYLKQCIEQCDCFSLETALDVSQNLTTIKNVLVEGAGFEPA